MEVDVLAVNASIMPAFEKKFDSNIPGYELILIFRYISRQNNQLRLKLVASKRLEAFMKDRIFFEGKRAGGTLISSQYSTKPMYFSKDKFVKKSKFNPIGKGSSLANRKAIRKHQKKQYARQKRRKTMYFPLGYKQFRDFNGRQVQKVDLNFSGSFKNSLRTVKDGDNVYLAILDISPLANPSISQEMKKDNIKKYNMHRQRYGEDIFIISPSEEEEGAKALELEIDAIVKEYFSRSIKHIRP